MMMTGNELAPPTKIKKQVYITTFVVVSQPNHKKELKLLEQIEGKIKYFLEIRLIILNI
jgi:hypothetical protein